MMALEDCGKEKYSYRQSFGQCTGHSLSMEGEVVNGLASWLGA